MTEISGTSIALALFGGILIGLAATLLLAMNGRIAGISGIVSGIVRPERQGDMSWRIAFVAGLMAAPFVTFVITQRPIDIVVSTPAPLLIIAGILVGVGTAIGGGCTSGHGVCGIARVSPRSFIATAIFFVMALIVVALMRHFMGGGQ